MEKRRQNQQGRGVGKFGSKVQIVRFSALVFRTRTKNDSCLLWIRTNKERILYAKGIQDFIYPDDEKIKNKSNMLLFLESV